MEVICRMYNTCYYRETCDHAKKHEIIANSFANNCILNNDGETVFAHGQYIKCHCDVSILRKQKLEKINRL